MALIDCPSCNKKISDKANSCQHCGIAIGSFSDEQLMHKKSLQNHLKNQSIQTQSLVAMLMFVCGFGFMYWGGALPGDLQHNVAAGTAVVGFIWYIVNRVRLIFLKKSN